MRLPRLPRLSPASPVHDSQGVAVFDHLHLVVLGEPEPVAQLRRDRHRGASRVGVAMDPAHDPLTTAKPMPAGVDRESLLVAHRWDPFA